MNSKATVPTKDEDDSSYFDSFSDNIDFPDYYGNGSYQPKDDFDVFTDFSDNNKISGKAKKLKKKTKRKINLSESAETFKNKYYSIFTRKKKFSKKIVKQIHEFMRFNLGLPKMTREEVRCSDIYFQNYEPFKIKILTFLIRNQRKIYYYCF